MKKIIIMAILIAVFTGIADDYIDFHDYSLGVGINNTLFTPLNNPGSTPEINNSTFQVDFNRSNNGQNLSDQNNSAQDLRVNTTINLISPTTRLMENNYFHVLVEYIYQDKFDSRSDKFEEPGLAFTFHVMALTNNSTPKPIRDAEIMLTIEGKYSVFKNYTVEYTNSQGYVTFLFNRPLTDTEWGYRLPSTQPVELEINAEFLGNEYYKPSKTMPIYTTHHPGEIDSTCPPVEEIPIFLIFGSVILTVVISLVLFFIVWYSDNKY